MKTHLGLLGLLSVLLASFAGVSGEAQQAHAAKAKSTTTSSAKNERDWWKNAVIYEFNRAAFRTPMATASAI